MQVPRRLTIVVCAAGGALLLAVGATVFRLEKTLSQTAHETAASHLLPFSLGPLGMRPNPGFQPFAGQARFRAGAVLDGLVYLSGAGGLTEYDGSGVQVRSLRVGMDLPAAALGPMVVARLRGSSSPQLAIASAGAGVLLLDARTGGLRQLLPEEPSLRDVTAVAALGSGDLLLGTRRHGVLLYDGTSLELYRPEYRDLAITTLLAEGDDLWVGTQEDGVLYTHAGVTRHFVRELADPHVEALAASGDHVFVGTPLGVEEFDGGTPARPLAAGVFAHALFATSEMLTIATLGDGSAEGVVEVALGSRRREQTAFLPGVSSTTGLARIEQLLVVGQDGDLYAVRADGLYRRRGGAWGPVIGGGREGAGEELTDNNVAALGFAPDGRLWIGYFDRGLDVVAAGSSEHGVRPASHLEDDHLFCINRIVADPRRGTMAVATANGLVLFDSAGKPRQVLSRRDGLISDHVTDVAFSGSQAGEMIVATSAGLSFVGETGIESLYAFQGLANNHVYALAVGADGDQLVAGTLGGISVLAHGAVRSNLTVANSGLRHNWITALVAMPAEQGGGYMVGTYGAGVMRLRASGQFEAGTAGSMEMPPGLVINPNAMLATSRHVLAGSLGRGLWSYSFAAGRWTQITDGLPSLNVTALAERGGELYVGTENGLVHIAEAKLER